MTTMSEHDEVLPLLAGEVLGGLDADEARWLDAHRRRCDRCADEAVALSGLVVDLGLTAPARSPSPSLASRVEAIARTSREPVAEPTPAQATTAGGGWRALFRRPTVALATMSIAVLLAVVAAGVTIEAIRLGDAVAARDGLIAVLADPAHVQARLAGEEPGVSAMAVFVPGSAGSYVIATGLPATPADRVYQLWAADADGAHPLGTFTHDGTGPFVAPFGVDLGSADAAMITLEPTGGAQGGVPGPQIVFGELPSGAQ